MGPKRGRGPLLTRGRGFSGRQQMGEEDVTLENFRFAPPSPGRELDPPSTFHFKKWPFNKKVRNHWPRPTRFKEINLTLKCQTIEDTQESRPERGGYD